MRACFMLSFPFLFLLCSCLDCSFYRGPCFSTLSRQDHLHEASKTVSFAELPPGLIHIFFYAPLFWGWGVHCSVWLISIDRLLASLKVGFLFDSFLYLQCVKWLLAGHKQILYRVGRRGLFCPEAITSLRTVCYLKILSKWTEIFCSHLGLSFFYLFCNYFHITE